jgi:hypothetical protein
MCDIFTVGMKTGMNSMISTKSLFVSLSEQNIELHFPTCTITCRIKFICLGMHCFEFCSPFSCLPQVSDINELQPIKFPSDYTQMVD